MWNWSIEKAVISSLRSLNTKALTLGPVRTRAPNNWETPMFSSVIATLLPHLPLLLTNDWIISIGRWRWWLMNIRNCFSSDEAAGSRRWSDQREESYGHLRRTKWIVATAKDICADAATAVAGHGPEGTRHRSGSGLRRSGASCCWSQRRTVNYWPGESKGQFAVDEPQQ